MKIIYDFGSHKGEDIEYYLKKADLVVAVEANPGLVEIIKDTYKKEIETKKLIVINCVLTREEYSEPVDFYVFEQNTLLSQFPKPDLPENVYELYKIKKISLLSRRASDIVKEYGEPHYIKIDIEHYDAEVLKDLFTENIFPQYISAESHEVDVFATFACLSPYNSYTLMEGNKVSSFKNHTIKNKEGMFEEHTFKLHDSGPFGEDLRIEWFDKSGFLKQLASAGLGWKDIHARKEKKD
jgi:FkbM family methyltransferase